jgi:poly-gamma-glutamate synthesis protein (capsule biosynthesis protein)
MPVDADKPWSVDLIDVPRILREARRARAAGADAVLVALHWGDEYSHAPSAYQRDVADRLTRSPDVTLVYGHHAHVVQPIRRVNGTWVIYGLGNLLAGQRNTAPGVNDGVVGLVTLRQRGSGPVRVLPPTYRPTYIDESDPRGEFRVYDVRRALADPRLDAQTRAELRASLARTDAVMGR